MSLVLGVGSGGGAPKTAQYVVLVADATLPNERVLTGTANRIVVTDGGAGLPVTLSPGALIVQTDQANTWTTGSQIIQTAVDTTTAFQVLDADGGNPVLSVDTVNERVGLGTSAPIVRLHVSVDGSIPAANSYTGDEVFLGSSNATNNFRLIRASNNVDSAAFVLFKARGTPDTPAEVQDNDQLGAIMWQGWRSGTRKYGFRIFAYVDAAPAANIATRLVFQAITTTVMVLKSSGYVNIGSDSDPSPGGMLQINPLTAATVGLVVKAAAAQTANLTNWETSAGVVVAYVDADGDADFNGHVAVGANAAVNAARVLNVNEVGISATSAWYLSDFYGQITDINDSAHNLYGQSSVVILDDPDGVSGIMFGNLSEARLTDGTVGEVGATKEVRGLQAIANLDGGTVIGDAIGLYAYADQEAGNTVSGSLYGARILVDADGTVGGNATILWLQALSNVDYSIYSAQDVKSIHRGALSVGKATDPVAELDVQAGSAATIGVIVKGAAAQTANLTNWETSAGVALLEVEATGELDFRWAMGDSTKDPTADAPVDWIQCKIGGVVRYLAAYAA